MRRVCNRLASKVGVNFNCTFAEVRSFARGWRRNDGEHQRRDQSLSLRAPITCAKPHRDFVGTDRDHGFAGQGHGAPALDARAVEVARAQPGAAAKVSGAHADRDLAVARGDRRMGQDEIAVECAADPDRRGVEALGERAPAFGVDDLDAGVDATHGGKPACARMVSRFETPVPGLASRAHLPVERSIAALSVSKGRTRSGRKP